MNHLRITKESLKIYREVYGSYSASKPTKLKYTFKKKVINTCVFKQKVVPLQS